MLKAIMSFFGLLNDSTWNYNREELSSLATGARIIDNGGITEGFPCSEWVKTPEGVWNNGTSVVSNEELQMPFMVVSEPADPFADGVQGFGKHHFVFPGLHKEVTYRELTPSEKAQVRA